MDGSCGWLGAPAELAGGRSCLGNLNLVTVNLLFAHCRPPLHLPALHTTSNLDSLSARNCTNYPQIILGHVLTAQSCLAHFPTHMDNASRLDHPTTMRTPQTMNDDDKLDNYSLARLRVQRADDEPEGLLARQLSREAIEETRAVAVETHTEIGPPPDGGRQAWCSVGAASCVLLVVFGFVTSMGQLQTYYMQHQLKGYSKSTVAWLGSVQSMLVYTGSMLAGRAFDAYGPERLMWTGTVLLTSAVVAMGCKSKSAATGGLAREIRLTCVSSLHRVLPVPPRAHALRNRRHHLVLSVDVNIGTLVRKAPQHRRQRDHYRCWCRGSSLPSSHA